MVIPQTSNTNLTFSCTPQSIDLTGRTAPSPELDEESLSSNPVLSPPPPVCHRSRDPALGSPLFVHDDDTPERMLEDEGPATSNGNDKKGKSLEPTGRDGQTKQFQYALPSDYGSVNGDEDMGCGMLRDGLDDDDTRSVPRDAQVEQATKHAEVELPKRDNEPRPDVTNTHTAPTPTPTLPQTTHLTFSAPPLSSKKIDTFTIIHHTPPHPTTSSHSPSNSRSSAAPDFDWETLVHPSSQSTTHAYRPPSLLLHRRTLASSPSSPTTAEQYHPQWEASQIVTLRAQQTMPWSAIAARLNAVRAQRPGRLPKGDWTEEKVYAAFLRETAARAGKGQSQSQAEGDGTNGGEKAAAAAAATATAAPAPKSILLGGRSGKGGVGGTRQAASTPRASRVSKAAAAATATAPHRASRLTPRETSLLTQSVAAVRARFWTDVAREMLQRGRVGKREGFWKEQWAEMHPGGEGVDEEGAVVARKWGGLRGGGDDGDGEWRSVEVEVEVEKMGESVAGRAEQMGENEAARGEQMDVDVDVDGADLPSVSELYERQRGMEMDAEWFEGRWGLAGGTEKRD